MSAMPSLSLSGSGQPSSSSKPSLSSGSSGHLSTSSRMPSPSRSPASARAGAALARRHADTRRARSRSATARDRGRGSSRPGRARATANSTLRLGQRQLARRALVGAVVARLLGDRAHLAHVRLELHAPRSRATASASSDTGANADQIEPSATPLGPAVSAHCRRSRRGVRSRSASAALPSRWPASPCWTCSASPRAWRPRSRARDWPAPRPCARTRSRPGTRRSRPLHAPCADTPRRPCTRRARSDRPARASPPRPPTPPCSRPG